MTVIVSRHGTVQPKLDITATPGTFCDAIVTMYSGTAMLTTAGTVHAVSST